MKLGTDSLKELILKDLGLSSTHWKVEFVLENT